MHTWLPLLLLATAGCAVMGGRETTHDMLARAEKFHTRGTQVSQKQTLMSGMARPLVEDYATAITGMYRYHVLVAWEEYFDRDDHRKARAWHIDSARAYDNVVNDYNMHYSVTLQLYWVRETMLAELW